MDSARRVLKEDLGFHGAPGKYATHGWHPFPAKFPPQLPRLFIQQLSSLGEIVLDPMAGSGTTLVEAQRLGRRSIGCDIDPLALLITSVKLTPIDVSEATACANKVLTHAEEEHHTHRADLNADLETRFDTKTRSFIDYWFLPEQQLQLVALLRAIEIHASGRTREFLRVVFSSTIIAKSGGVSRARDLAHTRPHRVNDKTPSSAFSEFRKRLTNSLAGAQQATLRSVGEVPNRIADGSFQMLLRSAATTELPPDSVDLIVTSPPYANGAIDYMRAHKFSLTWLGHRIEELTELRRQYLGHDAMGSLLARALPEQCESTLSALSERDPRKASVLRRYFGEMRDVIAEMRRVLRPGRAFVLVVATSVLRGLDVRTHENLAAIGEAEGLTLAGIASRELDRDKRMMPARWGNGNPSQIEKRMHEEHVVVWVKS